VHHERGLLTLLLRPDGFAVAVASVDGDDTHHGHDVLGHFATTASARSAMEEYARRWSTLLDSAGVQSAEWAHATVYVAGRHEGARGIFVWVFQPEPNERLFLLAGANILDGMDREGFEYLDHHEHIEPKRYTSLDAAIFGGIALLADWQPNARRKSCACSPETMLPSDAVRGPEDHQSEDRKGHEHQ
jgi:hypothetical protein